MSDFLERPSPEERDAVRERGRPDWIEPMLATLGHQPFSDPGWLSERKRDGVRLLTHRRRGRPRLLTRNRKERNATYPELEEALSGPGRPDVVVDGEVVAFEGNVTSFARLQARMHIEDAEEARAAERVEAFREER